MKIERFLNHHRHSFLYFLIMVMSPMLLISMGKPCYAQWAATYNIDGFNEVHAVQQTADGGYIVAGSVWQCGSACEDMLVMKLDGGGAVEWQKLYSVADNDDQANAIQQTSDGGYIVVGYSGNYYAGYEDAWVLKLTSAGEIEWQKTFGDRGYLNFTDARSVGQTSDGGYVVGCYTTLFGSGDLLLLKLDSSGNTQWQRRYGTEFGNDEFRFFELTSDSGYIVLSWGNRLMKLDANGTIQWQKSYSEWGDCKVVRQTNDGGYIMAGYTSATVNAEADVWIIKLDPQGEIKWQKAYGGILPDEARSIQQTKDGGYILAGYTTSFGEPDGDIWILRLDAAGNSQWQSFYDIAGNYDDAYFIQETADGGYVVVGRTSINLAIFPYYLFPILLMKLNPDGSLSPHCSLGQSIQALPVETAVSTTELDLITNDALLTSQALIATVVETKPSVNFICFGENCSDGKDNNGDGMADCSDPECCSVQQCKDTLGCTMADLEVKTGTPNRISPGETVNFVVVYWNQGGLPAGDAVVVAQLPSLGEYLSSTGGGIYRWDTHEVIWKLGDAESGRKGLLTVKMHFPWGLPDNTPQYLLAVYGTSSTERDYVANPEKEPLFDLQEYLAYQPLAVSSVSLLSPQDIADELAQDAQMNDLYQYTIESGYSMGVAVRLFLTDGSTVTEVLTLNPAHDMWFLFKIQGASFLTAYAENAITLFDRGGGMTYYADKESFDSFGTWSVPGSLTKAQCVFNCVNDKALAWLLKKLGKFSLQELKGILDLPNCIACFATKGASVEDCTKCANSITNIPGLGETASIGTCIYECAQDPDSHVCTKDKEPECSSGWGGWLGYDQVVIKECDRETGQYKIVPRLEETCNPQETGCTKYRAPRVCRVVDGKAQCVLEKDLCGSNSLCSQGQFPICQAHDPNIKQGPEGAVSAGQKLDYRLEFENEGEGTAYGVYFTDTLDEDLDDSTLVIGAVKSTGDDSPIAPTGAYNAGNRTITWQAGEVGPHQGGYADLSVNVRSDASKGTEIVNYGIVYFPSVPEVTYTNAVVSRIPVEDCGNEIDDDGDGLTDCTDPECDGICPETGNCHDLRDNDSDGRIDCLDQDCFGTGCEELCGDGSDNDGDTFFDCDDPDCAVDTFCCASTGYAPGISFVRTSDTEASEDRVLTGICVDEPFCEALQAGVDELLCKINDCATITVPGSMVQSNQNETVFTARSESGEVPSYNLRINCKRHQATLMLWDANLRACADNPVKVCLSIPGNTCLCAEENFIRRENRRNWYLDVSFGNPCR